MVVSAVKALSRPAHMAGGEHCAKFHSRLRFEWNKLRSQADTATTTAADKAWPQAAADKFVYRRSSSGTRAAFGDFSPVEGTVRRRQLSAVAGWIMSVRDACFTGSRLAALAVPSSNRSATNASLALTTWLASCFASRRSIASPPALCCPLKACFMLPIRCDRSTVEACRKRGNSSSLTICQ